MDNAFNEGKMQRVSPIHPEDAGEVGPLYIDANVSSGNTQNESSHALHRRNMMKVPKGSFFGGVGFLRAEKCITNQLNQRTLEKCELIEDNLRFDN
ncbi:hypothetical protein SADUNF_Sadunf16G0309700 [Salix dunnii]|uniref:Uncharacterized protein n=1 Tax=Salix dunnii TaxID=1413687 RepID=A0A835JF55_9ROSI|nr:hypothetical protein SADUNF_Sadunf16G0309700 [Salix dunnii]